MRRATRERHVENLTSGWTPFFRFVFPAFWIGAFALGTAGAFSAGSPQRWRFLAGTAVASTLLLAYARRLALVSLDDDGLVISRRRRTIRVPITEVERATVTRTAPVLARLHLRRPTVLGSCVVFLPSRPSHLGDLLSRGSAPAWVARTEAPADLPFARVAAHLLERYDARSTRPPASTEALAAFEQRFGVALPDDVVHAYLWMDGTEDYTDLDAGWMRYWPIEEWKPVVEELPGLAYASDECAEWFACADHGIWAEFFAIDLDPRGSGHVYSIGGDAPRLVALTFTEFVELALDESMPLFRP